MTRRKKELDTTGIINRGRHLQLDLRAYGFGKERLDLEVTPKNIELAVDLRNTILREIRKGEFSLAKYFPKSPRVLQDKNSITWEKLGDEWLSTRRNQLAHSTYEEYERTLKGKHFTDWNQKILGDLDFRALQRKIGALPAKPKTFNNIVSVLKMVLEYGHKANLLREPLQEHIEFLENPEPVPDPFNLKEIDLILSKIHDRGGRNMYEFGFFSGVRPSELIALRWSHVDLERGEVVIQAAITRSKEKGTKTGKTRTIELTSRARQALERQALITKSATGPVFVGLNGAGYMTTDGPLDAFWKPALQAVADGEADPEKKLRYRDARQTRHTFATICLHAGSKPGWVSDQLGHSKELFFRVYSKWIKGQDDGAERKKLDQFLAAH